MKKFVAILILVAGFVSQSGAQKQTARSIPSLPVDSTTKLITYQKVVQVPGIKQEDLYRRALSWFNKYYKNPGEVIRENDSVKFVITGKPRHKIQNPADKDGLETDAGLIQYTITVAAKEGRFRYELTAWNWRQPSYFAAERWFDTKSKTYTPVYNHYLEQLDQYANDVIKSLVDQMTSSKQSPDRDKW